MDKVRKNLERALAAVQLARNEMDRLNILKKSPVVDDETKAIVGEIVHTANAILGNSKV
ncbi:hypothetical protein IMZ68_06855 [Candidatus Bathyarchaeota archaeon]|nr:hypothetical protein [Candidatus Bathyarchaeota archaeon]